MNEPIFRPFAKFTRNELQMIVNALCCVDTATINPYTTDRLEEARSMHHMLIALAAQESERAKEELGQ